jgi:hypothetical protein
MTAYYFDSIPKYYLDKLVAVRDIYDNFTNTLVIAEIINNHPFVSPIPRDPKYDLIIYSGDYQRAFIMNSDGFSSMAVPFGIVENEGKISFNCDSIKHPVNSYLISIFRNAIKTCQESDFSFESLILSLVENFNIDDIEATKYLDAFMSALNQDHGYFRYDDDEPNQNGDIHPRYHLDIFIKNTSTIKIGTDLIKGLDCFYSLCDKNLAKKYLRVNTKPSRFRIPRFSIKN